MVLFVASSPFPPGKVAASSSHISTIGLHMVGWGGVFVISILGEMRASPFLLFT